MIMIFQKEQSLLLESRGDDKRHYLVPEYTPVSGAYFKDARVSTDGGDMGVGVAVAFEFDAEGGKRFTS